MFCWPGAVGGEGGWGSGGPCLLVSSELRREAACQQRDLQSSWPQQPAAQRTDQMYSTGAGLDSQCSVIGVCERSEERSTSEAPLPQLRSTRRVWAEETNRSADEPEIHLGPNRCCVQSWCLVILSACLPPSRPTSLSLSLSLSFSHMHHLLFSPQRKVCTRPELKFHERTEARSRLCPTGCQAVWPSQMHHTAASLTHQTLTVHCTPSPTRPSV